MQHTIVHYPDRDKYPKKAHKKYTQPQLILNPLRPRALLCLAVINIGSKKLFLNPKIPCVPEVRIRVLESVCQDLFVILKIPAQKLRRLQLIRTVLHTITAARTVLYFHHLILPVLSEPHMRRRPAYHQ